MKEKIFFTDDDLKLIIFVLRFYLQSLKQAKSIFIRNIGKKAYDSDFNKVSELLKKIQ